MAQPAPLVEGPQPGSRPNLPQIRRSISTPNFSLSAEPETTSSLDDTYVLPNFTFDKNDLQFATMLPEYLRTQPAVVSHHKGFVQALTQVAAGWHPEEVVQQLNDNMRKKFPSAADDAMMTEYDLVTYMARHWATDCDITADAIAHERKMLSILPIETVNGWTFLKRSEDGWLRAMQLKGPDAKMNATDGTDTPDTEDTVVASGSASVTQDAGDIELGDQKGAPAGPQCDEETLEAAAPVSAPLPSTPKVTEAAPVGSRFNILATIEDDDVGSVPTSTTGSHHPSQDGEQAPAKKRKNKNRKRKGKTAIIDTAIANAAVALGNAQILPSSPAAPFWASDVAPGQQALMIMQLFTLVLLMATALVFVGFIVIGSFLLMKT